MKDLYKDNESKQEIRDHYLDLVIKVFIHKSVENHYKLYRKKKLKWRGKRVYYTLNITKDLNIFVCKAARSKNIRIQYRKEKDNPNTTYRDCRIPGWDFCKFFREHPEAWFQEKTKEGFTFQYEMINKVPYYGIVTIEE